MADAVFGDGVADIEIKPGNSLSGQELVLVEQWEGPLFTGQIHRRHVGSALDRPHPVFRQLNRSPAAITCAGQDQGIGQPAGN